MRVLAPIVQRRNRMRRIILASLLAMFAVTSLTNLGCKAKVDENGASVKTTK